MNTTIVLVLKDGTHRHMSCDGERFECVVDYFRESLQMGRDIARAVACYGTRIEQYTANEVRDLATVQV